MKNYQHLLKKIITENTFEQDGQMCIEMRETRSGNCASIFGHMMEWDLRKGFPAVTTKKLAFDIMIRELLMFLSGSCDRRVMHEKGGIEFKDEKWDIWKQDCERAAKTNPDRFNGYNLGEMYPEMWRHLYVGDVSIFEEIPERFDKDADYVETETLNGKPKIFGVGYLGTKSKSIGGKWIYNTWRSMLERCYNPSCKSYENYGGKGVTVSPRWHNYSNFLEDVYCLPNFQKKVQDSSWGLDKDYYSGSVYSRNTCIFLPKGINSKLTGTKLKYNDKYFLSISDFEEFIGVSKRGSLERALKKGATVVEDSRILPKLFKDQIQDLIDTIKEDPTSRRIVVDNWNVDYKVKSVLSACHNMFQVFISDKGELDLMFNLRASDTFLGLPINIASYAALAHIIAKLTNTRVRYLKCSLGVVEIYEQHLEPVFEQLDREPFNAPRFVMPDFVDLNHLLTFTAKDFRLRDYGHHGVLKGKLTVGADDE